MTSSGSASSSRGLALGRLAVVRLESRLGALSCPLTQPLGRPVVHGARIARVYAPVVAYATGRIIPGVYDLASRAR